MSDETAIPHLREIVVFLVAAGFVVPLFHRLRVSPVLGFLIVGTCIGPYGLGALAGESAWLRHVVIGDLEEVRGLAELGVVFLLFAIGLDLSLGRLWELRRLVLGLGGLQIAATAALIAAIASAFGNEATAAIVVGACLALSSTAVVMQLLVEQRRLGTLVGRTCFSVLLMQDLAVVPILFVVGLPGGGGIAGPLAVALATAAAALVGIYVLGRLVLQPLLRLVAQTRSAEMFTAAILLVVVGMALATSAAGLSMALGAFLAGLLLAETAYRHEIEVDIAPFKGLMLGLFFMSVGMGLDVRLIVADALWIGASVIGLVALKATVMVGLGLAFGLPRHAAVESGLLLGQAGEFAFVVVGLAIARDLVPAEVGQFMMLVAGLSMLATPMVAAAAERLARRIERPPLAAGAPLADLEGLEGHVVIAGFGRVGGTLARVLDAQGIPYLAIDADPRAVEAARRRGLPATFGDASRADILERARTRDARAAVVTMDAADVAERVVSTLRERFPGVAVYARARDPAQAGRMAASGAMVAVPETTEASLQLAGRVLGAFGLDEEAVRQVIDRQRSAEIEGG